MKKRTAPKPSPLLRSLIQAAKPTRAEKYREALAGDMAAVQWLHFDKHEIDDKLDLLIDLCRDGCHKPTFRTLLLDCLIDHPRRIHPEAHGSSELLAKLLTYADFEHHPDIPETLTLYRGTGAISLEVAKTGYFWTPSADYAATYAIKHADRKGGDPMLIRAEVQRSDVAVFFNPFLHSFPTLVSPGDPLGEWEAILTSSPSTAFVEEILNIDELREQEAAKMERFHAHMARGDDVIKRALAGVRKRMAEVGYQP